MGMEENIILENGDYWVYRENKAYVVYKTGLTHSTSDSAFALTENGKSIAIARCNYLAKRDAEKTAG